MTKDGWLIDKSALVRLKDSRQRQHWSNRIERGLVRIASVTALEVGFSAQSGAGLRRIRKQPPLSLLPIEYLTPGIEDRAIGVQQLLADRGQHRAPAIPDLLIAAIAESTGLTILHLDKDFELISEVTGQPQQRLDDQNNDPSF